MPKFKIGDCINWDFYKNICITEVDEEKGYYSFGKFLDAPIETVDNGHKNIGINKFLVGRPTEYEPAVLVVPPSGGKKRRRASRKGKRASRKGNRSFRKRR